MIASCFLERLFVHLCSIMAAFTCAWAGQAGHAHRRLRLRVRGRCGLRSWPPREAEAPKKPVGRGARSRSRSGQRKDARTSSADLWEAAKEIRAKMSKMSAWPKGHMRCYSGGM